MTLTLTATAAPAIVKLSPAKFGEQVKAFKALALLKKETAAAAAAAEKSHKAARDALLLALGGAEVATCGNYVLTVKTGAAAEASLTFADGVKTPWSAVSSVTIGNRQVSTAGSTLYGGRSGALTIDVVGG